MKWKCLQLSSNWSLFNIDGPKNEMLFSLRYLQSLVELMQGSENCTADVDQMCPSVKTFETSSIFRARTFYL